MKKIVLSFLLFFALICQSQEQLSNFDFSNLTAYEPRDFISYNGKFYFIAATDATGVEIWMSDGSLANTEILKDFNPGPGNGGYYDLKVGSVILNDELYFIAGDDTSVGELWKTDGTSAGTAKITNFLNGAVTNLTRVGNEIFFLITTGFELDVWKTDGTSAGTVQVSDNLPIWNRPTFEGEINDTFIFTFQPEGTNNSRVWRSDGTSVGTVPITNEIDGNGSGTVGTSALSQYIKMNDKLYFVSRYDLYETDGTVANTQVVSDVWNAQNLLVDYSDAIVVGGKLYLMFYNAAVTRLSIWESDGTEANTREVYQENSNVFFYPSNLITLANTLVFCTESQVGETALVYLDLSDYSTTVLYEFPENPRTFGSFLSYLEVYRLHEIEGTNYFLSYYEDSSKSKKGMLVDFLTLDFNFEPDLDNVDEAFTFNDQLYYSQEDQLWRFSNTLSNEFVSTDSVLSVYPNPSTDVIRLQSASVPDKIEIFDPAGRLVKSINNYNNQGISIASLNQGIYFLKVSVNNRTSVRRIIKN